MIWIAIFVAVLCLAFANGANDNFKGVASLFGSGTTNYKRALTWATVTTLLGSITAVFLAGKLLTAFTGKGLVDSSLAGDAHFAAAVAMGAGLTVLLATRIGMPISTTHSLVGALIGTGWAAGSAINTTKLTNGFLVPLVASPILAISITVICYPLLRNIRRRLRVGCETCFCVGREVLETRPIMGGAMAIAYAEELTASVGEPVTCESRYRGRVFGFEAGWVLDRLHFLSSGIVSFARGLNDTPKVAALLLIAPAVGAFDSIAVIGITIAIGGLFAARRVAETMSHRITLMNHGQGFTANVVTGVVVIGASRLGVPVSTTHVSCGALFGIGSVTGQARWRVISTILCAWITTLPTGAVLGIACYQLTRWL